MHYIGFRIRASIGCALIASSRAVNTSAREVNATMGLELKSKLQTTGSCERRRRTALDVRRIQEASMASAIAHD